MLNKVILIGRLANPPELRYSGSGVAVTNFRLAVERNYTNSDGKRETDFFPVVTFKKTAEAVAHNVTKGRLVAVEGRLQVRSWKQDDGQRRYITEIVADNVRFLDWPKDGQQQGGQAQGGGYDGMDEDSVPF